MGAGRGRFVRFGLGLIFCLAPGLVLAQAPGREPAIFVSPAGRVRLSGFGGNRVSPGESTRMRLTLVSAADGRRLEPFILHNTVVAEAAIHDPGDGLELAFRHVVLTGKSVDPSGRVTLTLVFRSISVRCGPPTCLNGGTR